MELRRALVLGSFIGSILVACSSHNTFFFGDGGPDGAVEPDPQGDAATKTDAKKRDTGTADDGGEGIDTGKDTGKADVSTCTLTEQVSSDPTCNGCAESSCCTQVNGCFVSSDCIALDTCYSNCTQPDANAASACLDACDSAHSGSVAKWNAASQCLQNSCASECGL
jgi:hypothetical protein